MHRGCVDAVWRRSPLGGVTGTKHTPAALVGATVFAASDAVLAVDKFDGGLPYGKVVIMVTYWTAQWFLVQGLI